MADSIEKEIAPFARKAKTLLREVNKELSTIPEYKNADFIANKSDRKPRRVDIIPDTITAIRRGIRLLKGKESKLSLQKKKKKLQGFLERAEELKGTVKIEGTNSFVKVNGS